MKKSPYALAGLVLAEEKAKQEENKAIELDKHTLKRLTKLNKRWRNAKSGKIKQIMENITNDSI
jgi:hypothetical protein